MYNKQRPKLFEGLSRGDLKDMISPTFTVDQYKSKMGNDESIIVLSFKAEDKFPAIDLMEFIEKGYPFVLDADMSSGEEQDGDYAVFVELERNPDVSKEVETLLRGISQLCNCTDWKFRYFKDVDSHEFTKEAFAQFVPLSVEDYKLRVEQQKKVEASDILNQGTAAVESIDFDNNLVITKPYATSLTAKLEAMGFYEDVKQILQGPIQLDEASNSQTLFLEKYLGNYEITKIDNKFLIKNGNKALIISKDRW